MATVYNSMALDNISVAAAATTKWINISNNACQTDVGALPVTGDYLANMSHINVITTNVPVPCTLLLQSGTNVADANGLALAQIDAIWCVPNLTSAGVSQYDAGAGLLDKMGSSCVATNNGAGWDIVPPSASISPGLHTTGFTLQFLFPEPIPGGGIGPFMVTIGWSDNTSNSQVQPNSVRTLIDLTGF
jgi:hypothetical protein